LVHHQTITHCSRSGLMDWGPRRLPIVLDPLSGEGLDSWLETYARRLRSCSRDLLDHLGLASSTLSRMVTTLTPAEREILSAGTGIAPHVLTGMTLQPLHGIAVTIDPTRRTTVHPPAWRRQTGSRFCPTCLGDSDGRWLLRWRLPWAFACPIHARLLVDLCPDCGKRPSPHRPGTRADATIAGHCTVALPSPTPGGWRAQTCGRRLTQIPARTLPAGGAVVAAQRRLDHLLTAAARTTDMGRREHICRTLGEMHSLAYKGLDALHATGIQPPSLVQAVLDECGGAVPARRGRLDSYDAHTIAVATSLAVAAHQGRPEGDAVLSWIIAADRQQRMPAEPGRILKPFTGASPALTARILHALDPHLQIHDRLIYGSAGRYPRRPDPTDEQIRRRAASLPALLWPAWAIRLIPTDKMAHNAVTSTRAGLAAMVLIPGTRLTCQQAIDLLGELTTRASATTTLSRLTDQQRSATIAILTDLAHALDTSPAPIDYTRRRALFRTPTVDRAAYSKLAAAHGWRPPSPLQLRLLDDHLTVALTGTRPDHHTTRIRWGGADAWNPLTLTLPAPVRDFIDDQARHLLHQHGINEPVTWQPPVPAGIRWPGIDPDTINPDQFTDAFTTNAAARDALQLIRHATGLNGVQVRLYTQLAGQTMPEPQWDALAEHPDADLLAPATLHYLYEEQGLSMMDIARLSRTTEPAVRDAFTAAGITPLANGQHSRPVPLSWLQQHYQGTGKTIGQAAAEAGVSRNTFAKYARLHHIPTTEHARAVNPFTHRPLQQQPPANVMAAFSGRNGTEYVRQILAMPGHPTQRAAAAALGLHEVVLMRHRQHVEHAAGIRIFQPTQPLTPTPDGTRFLAQATLALRQLDLADSGKS
jgi:hypothetical protein